MITKYCNGSITLVVNNTLKLFILSKTLTLFYVSETMAIIINVLYIF